MVDVAVDEESENDMSLDDDDSIRQTITAPCGGPGNTSWSARAGNPCPLTAVIPNGPRERERVRERVRERERTQEERGTLLRRVRLLSS